MKNGQFDRDAAADALRKFLEDTVRAGKQSLAPGGDELAVAVEHDQWVLAAIEDVDVVV